MALGGIIYSGTACARIRALGIPDDIFTDLQEINAQELRAFLLPPSPVEGFRDFNRTDMWRRAVWLRDVPWFQQNPDGPTPGSWDYFSLYRYATAQERRPYGYRNALIVTSVINEAQFARLVIDHPGLRYPGS